MHAPSDRHLSLLLPGVAGPPPVAAANDAGGGAETPELPALETLLARADRGGTTVPGSLEALLFALFEVGLAADADPPVAAVTRMTDMGVVDQEWWVRADPVYLEPRGAGLVLHPVVGLSVAEATRLAGELQEMLGPDGWLLRAPRTDRWYLKPPQAPHLRTHTLDEAAGRDVHPLLPYGRDATSWHTRLNEIQILLHTSVVNAEREARGLLPANSVWFWGGGRLPPSGAASWAQVWSDEPLSLGLARLSAIPVASPPADGRGWLASAQAPGRHLLVLDAGTDARLGDDSAAWRAWLSEVEERWAAPLLTALQRDDLASLSIYPGGGRCFQVSRRRLWRWWRRRRRLGGLRGATCQRP